jgi:hypothetical protein
MVHYIFSFSYIEKKKIKELKNLLLFSTLGNDVHFNFLTKKNFNLFFSNKYLELKNILSGKYLIFSLEKKDCAFNEMLITFELIHKLLANFENDISLFTIILKNTYIFNDFLIKSNSYKSKNLFDLTNINNKFFISSLLKREIISYNFNFTRINNLNLEKKKIYLSYFF